MKRATERTKANHVRAGQRELKKLRRNKVKRTRAKSLQQMMRGRRHLEPAHDLFTMKQMVADLLYRNRRNGR